MRIRLHSLVLLLPLLVWGCPKNGGEAASTSGSAAAPERSDGKVEARAVWDAMNEASNAFEPTAYDYYAPKAVLKTKRYAVDGTVSTRGFAVSMFLPMVPELMENAKLVDDRATYTNVTMEPDGERWKISAHRYSTVKCNTDKEYYALLGQGDDGTWLIDEEFAVTTVASNCAPNPDEARRVLGELAAKLAPLLPMDLDSETRLDSVVQDDLTMTSSSTLVNTPSTYEHLDEFIPEMRKAARKQGCGQPSSKYVLHHGGTLRYVYLTSDGTTALDMTLTTKECFKP